MNKYSKILTSLFLLISTHSYTFDDFIVNDIRISGLQRVSTGSIFNTIPISVGDKIDERKIILKISESIKIWWVLLKEIVFFFIVYQEERK